MGNLDVLIQYFIFVILLPLMLAFIVVRWYFDLNLKKIRTWIEASMLKRTHKLLEQEKKLFFGHMNRMRFGNSLNEHTENNSLNILEIGVGSGRNFKLYPENALVTCLEPNRHMESYIKDSIRNAKKNLTFKKLVTAFAEDMKGIDDKSFDIVLCTLTLCTVRNPDAALQEVRRVLKPGGKFFFLEHVAASKKSLSRWLQDNLNSVWSRICGGCQLNRETWTYLDNADFSEVSYHHFQGSIWFFFVRSWMYGTATK